MRKNPPQCMPENLLANVKEILLEELYRNFLTIPETAEHLLQDVNSLKRLTIMCQCPFMLRNQIGQNYWIASLLVFLLSTDKFVWIGLFGCMHLSCVPCKTLYADKFELYWRPCWVPDLSPVWLIEFSLVTWSNSQTILFGKLLLCRLKSRVLSQNECKFTASFNISSHLSSNT